MKIVLNITIVIEGRFEIWAKKLRKQEEQEPTPTGKSALSVEYLLSNLSVQNFALIFEVCLSSQFAARTVQSGTFTVE